MRRAATRVLALAGLVAILCAAMGFVLLGSTGTWRTHVHVPAGHRAVVVEPALASVIGPLITLRVRAADAGTPLFVAHARPDDTAALLRGTDQVRLTGLRGVRAVRTTTESGDAPVPDADSVDVWSEGRTGQGTVALAYRADVGAQSVVVTRSDGGALPELDVQLGWSDRSWYWVPSVALALGLGLLVAARWWRRPAGERGPGLLARRRDRRRERARAAAPAKHVGRRRAEPSGGRR